MTDPAAVCIFAPAHEPWSCSTHPGGYRVSLNETACRTAQAETVAPMTPEEVAEFDRWAESRRGKGVSLGLLWALRLRATLLAAGVRVAGEAGLREAALRAALRLYHLQHDDECGCEGCDAFDNATSEYPDDWAALATRSDWPLPVRATPTDTEAGG